MILKPRHTMLLEATSPPAHRLRAHPQPPGDLGVAVALGREQHQLRSQHLPMRPRVARSAMLKLDALALLEHDLLSASTQQRPPESLPEL
jgi:hypothetical protein